MEVFCEKRESTDAVDAMRAVEELDLRVVSDTQSVTITAGSVTPVLCLDITLASPPPKDVAPNTSVLCDNRRETRHIPQRSHTCDSAATQVLNSPDRDSTP